VIVPIFKNDNKKAVLKEVNKLKESLDDDFEIHVDDRDSYSPGWKFNEWEMKGVPIRLEIGPKDIEKKQVVLVRRDNGEKKPVKIKGIEKVIEKTLDLIHNNMFERAGKFLKDNTKNVKDMQQFEKLIKDGKMVRTYWCGNGKCEEKIKDKTSATIRCIENENAKTKGKCVGCSTESKTVVYFAKAY
ncbi:MAG: proline--tRNA ligase, partial [Candidatus Aenigmarchaeota archaeon]|nr:proline--tRNA ligase [Candidatus Aenigmarchaeota archaeon]